MWRRRVRPHAEGPGRRQRSLLHRLQHVAGRRRHPGRPARRRYRRDQRQGRRQPPPRPARHPAAPVRPRPRRITYRYGGRDYNLTDIHGRVVGSTGVIPRLPRFASLQGSPGAPGLTLGFTSDALSRLNPNRGAVFPARRDKAQGESRRAGRTLGYWRPTRSLLLCYVFLNHPIKRRPKPIRFEIAPVAQQDRGAVRRQVAVIGTLETRP